MIRPSTPVPRTSSVWNRLSNTTREASPGLKLGFRFMFPPHGPTPSSRGRPRDSPAAATVSTPAAGTANEIPYVPEWKLAAGIGYVAEKWGVNLDAIYTGTSWGTGYNDDIRTGRQTSRDGQIDALLVFNLSAYYQLNEHIKLLAGVQNLFDERALVSRIPEGPRANAPRIDLCGLRRPSSNYYYPGILRENQRSGSRDSDLRLLPQGDCYPAGSALVFRRTP